MMIPSSLCCLWYVFQQREHGPTVVKSRVNPQIDVSWVSESGQIDCFIFFGPLPAQVFSQYAQLTGISKYALIIHYPKPPADHSFSNNIWSQGENCIKVFVFRLTEHLFHFIMLAPCILLFAYFYVPFFFFVLTCVSWNHNVQKCGGCVVCGCSVRLQSITLHCNNAQYTDQDKHRCWLFSVQSY